MINKQKYRAVLHRIVSQTYDKISDKNNRHELPHIFRGKTPIVWGIGFFLAYLCIAIQSDFKEFYLFSDKTNVINALYVNAGILTTMLTVTLGVTLIGLQFRMQSYTMVGLINYLNNRVVYGFIIFFMYNIMLSIIAAIELSFLPNAEIMIFYAMTGTMFSLCYYVGYIYHVVYRLQPSQILSDVYQKMKNMNIKIVSDQNKKTIEPHNKRIHSKVSNIEYDIDDEPFEIWKDVVKKAIDADDKNMFRECMRIVLNLKQDKKSSNNTINIISIFSTYISEVMRYCTEQNRHRLENEFMEIIEKTEIMMGHDNFQTREWSKIVLELLNQIMFKAVSNDDEDIFSKSMNTVMIILRTNLKRWEGEEMENEINLVSKNIYDGIQLCTEQNRHRLENIFMKMIEDTDIMMMDQNDTKTMEKWRLAILANLTKIMFKAVSNDDENAFVNSMHIIMRIVHKSLENWEDRDLNHMRMYVLTQVNTILKICIEKNHHRLENIFLEDIVITYTTNADTVNADILMINHDSSDIREWRVSVLKILSQIMLKAVSNDDENAFMNSSNITMIVLHKILEKCTNEEIESMMNFVSRNIYDGVQSCIEQNRYRLERVFLFNIGNKDLLMMDQIDTKIIENWRKKMLANVTKIMYKAVRNYDENAFVNSIEIMMKILHGNPECENQVPEYMKAYISNEIYNVMEFCIEQNRHRLETIFMNKIRNGDMLMMDYENSKIVNIWIRKMLSILEQIMLKAVANDDTNTFKNSLMTAMNILRYGIKNHADDIQKMIVGFVLTDITKIIESSTEQNRYRLDQTFIRIIVNADFLIMNDIEPQISKDWRLSMLKLLFNIMNKAIRNNNSNTFSDGLEGITEIRDNIMNKCTDDKKEEEIGFIINNIMNMMEFCMEQNQYYLISAFLISINDRKMLMTGHVNSQIKDAWEQTIWNISLIIINDIINTNKQVLFEVGISTIFHMYDKRFEQSSDKEYVKDSFSKNIITMKMDCKELNRTEFAKRITELGKQRGIIV